MTLFVVFLAVFCQGRVSVGFCNIINKIEATTESATCTECKDGKSSDNAPRINEEKCTDGMVPVAHKDQTKLENVDDEYENLSEDANMKRNCIDGSCAFTCQVFLFTF